MKIFTPRGAEFPFFNGFLKIRLLLTSLLLTTLCSGVLAQTFKAHLSGGSEVPAVLTTAYGSVEATLDGNQLILTGSFTGLSSNLRIGNNMPFTHIHLGLAGQNGGISVQLVPTMAENQREGTFTAAQNTFTLTTEQLAALNARQFYVNIHSVNFPGGEIRGQLLPEATAYFSADLYGSNEVPSVISSGSGRLVLEHKDNTLVVSGSFTGLGSDLASSIRKGTHLHVGFAGQNGGIQLELTPTVADGNRSGVFAAADNTFTLTEVQATMLAERRLYANIHSLDFTSGELRGQVVGLSDAVFRTHLSGTNERPAVSTMANGELVLELKKDTLIVSGSFSGLESAYGSAGSHLHIGYAGQNGGVRIPLTASLTGDARGGTYTVAQNTYTLTPEQKELLLQRRLYANIHSTVFPGGEIRGQVLPGGQNFFPGFVSAVFEVPPVVSLANGGILAEVHGNKLVLTGSFSGLASNYTMSHIHLGQAGTNGGIVFTLVPTLAEGNRGGIFEASSNTFDLNEEALVNLRARRYYVNIHSANNPPGEIRGQLLHEATTYFSALLSGSSETNPVNTPATGAVMAEVSGTKMILSGSFRALSSEWNQGAHIHEGNPGRNGTVVFTLPVNIADNQRAGSFAVNKEAEITLTPDQLVQLRNRLYYVNVHTTGHEGGEVRGQLLPLATHYFTATLRGFNEVPTVASTGTGSAKLEVNGTRVIVTGSFTGLASDYNAPSGAHIHVGAAGANGGVVFPLAPTLENDLRGGIFGAAENTLTFTNDQINALVAGNYYINVHTTGNTAGELRGQILPEINFFPSNTAAITIPAPGSAVTIQGLPDAEFRAEWTAATDPNGNPLSYIWQLSAAEDFSAVLVSQNVGANLFFSTTAGTLDGLLSTAGLPVGGTITLYHRVIASDGSLQTSPGTVASAVITRGLVTGIRDEILRSFTYQVYPSPLTSEAFVALEAVKGGKAKLVVSDLLGRPVIDKEIQITNGHNNYTLDLNRQQSGVYLVQISVDGHPLPVRRILKR
jgi:hypothetical protein